MWFLVDPLSICPSHHEERYAVDPAVPCRVSPGVSRTFPHFPALSVCAPAWGCGCRQLPGCQVYFTFPGFGGAEMMRPSALFYAICAAVLLATVCASDGWRFPSNNDGTMACIQGSAVMVDMHDGDYKKARDSSLHARVRMCSDIQSRTCERKARARTHIRGHAGTEWTHARTGPPASTRARATTAALLLHSLACARTLTREGGGRSEEQDRKGVG